MSRIDATCAAEVIAGEWLVPIECRSDPAGADAQNLRHEVIAEVIAESG